MIKVNTNILGSDSILLPGNIELKFKGRVPGNDKSYVYGGNSAEVIATVGEGLKMNALITLDGGVRKMSIETWLNGQTLLKVMDMEKLRNMHD